MHISIEQKNLWPCVRRATQKSFAVAMALNGSCVLHANLLLPRRAAGPVQQVPHLALVLLLKTRLFFKAFTCSLFINVFS